MNSNAPWSQFIITLVVISVSCSKALANEPSTGESPIDFKRYVTSVRTPDYPRAARDRGLTGSGLASLKIDAGTGEVKAVTITQSTGHAILDKAASYAYRRWRFVPHTISQAEVPIIFTTLGSVDPSLETSAKGLAIRSPRPEYPLKALELHMVGTGAAILEVNQPTGVVTSVRMAPSTGHKLLDDAAMNAFRQWLFRPGAVKRIKIPVRYRRLGGFSY
jgi:TonB family protein